MTGPPPGACTDCGKSGLLYTWQDLPYCPACLLRRKPPKEYDGRERRSRVKKPSIFTRRIDEKPPRSNKP